VGLEQKGMAHISAITPTFLGTLDKGHLLSIKL